MMVRPFGIVAVGVVAVGCATVPLPEPFPAAVEAGRERVPGSTLETLEQGRTIAMLECAECHRPPKPTKKDFDQWPATLDKMAKKAELSEAEKALVLAYMQVMSIAPKPPPEP